jgi:hypothetical protein
MRYIFAILISTLFYLTPFKGMSQSDTIPTDTIPTTIIRVDTSTGYPALGKDVDGNKYFVMLPKQEKALLITLYQSMYTDSLLQRTQELELKSQKLNDELVGINRKMAQKIVEYEANQHDLTLALEKKDELNYGLSLINKSISSENKRLQKENRFNKILGIGGITLGVAGVIFGIVN